MPSKNHNNPKIILFGAGNLAHHFGMALKGTGINIIQLYNRSPKNGKELADKLKVPFTGSISELKINEATIFLFAISDGALPGLIKSIGPAEVIMVHTAASVSADVFNAYTTQYGVIYPLQTFTKGKIVDFSQTNLFIEGNNKNTEAAIRAVAEKLSSHIYVSDSAQRLNIHLAAVLACNFTNHLYTLAGQILKENDIPFNILYPLIDETTEKIKIMDPSQAQTGPARRKDYGTLLKHLGLMENRADLQNLYSLLTESIINFYEE